MPANSWLPRRQLAAWRCSPCVPLQRPAHLLLNEMNELRREVLCWKLVCQDLQHTRRVRKALHEERLWTESSNHVIFRQRHMAASKADNVSLGKFGQILRQLAEKILGKPYEERESSSAASAEVRSWWICKLRTALREQTRLLLNGFSSYQETVVSCYVASNSCASMTSISGFAASLAFVVRTFSIRASS